MVRKYKIKKENSRAIATPGHSLMNNEENNKSLSNNPIEVVIPNQEQGFTSSYNNQQGTTRKLGNNSIENAIIQNIRQEMTQNSSNNGTNLSSYNIDENIIDQMKQEILQDIKQELKQDIRSKVMTSFLRDSNFEDSSSSSNR